MKTERVEDPIYNGIVKYGRAAVPCLIERITDVTPMKDPRKAPIYRGFKIGDAAVFLLHRITGLPLEEMLPEEVNERMKEDGVYAYFDYVRRPANRAAIQHRWSEWLKRN
jgi:hypothetical protein